MTPGDRTELLTLLSAYCDDTLDAAGLDRLEEVLSAGPDARRVYAEYMDVHARLTARRGAVVQPRRPATSGRWVWAAGLVGVAAALFVAVRPAVRPTGPSGVVSDRSGPVTVSPDGRMVATLGVTASAVVTYPGGASVTLGGDTVAEIADGPTPKLSVRKGAVAASVPASSMPLVVATDTATAVIASGGKLVVDAGRAEFGVRAGSVRVTGADDDAGTEMGEGELLTVGPDGATKRPLVPAPDGYEWDFGRPPPDGWEVGRWTPERTVRPQLWFDIHLRPQRNAWQIRTDPQWAAGQFTVHPDTRMRVRYRVARHAKLGKGQLLLTLRPDPIEKGTCIVRHLEEIFRNVPLNEWRTIEMPVTAIPPTKESAPVGNRTWVNFQVVFNTYDDDLGLEVSEFRVFRPGEPAP